MVTDELCIRVSDREEIVGMSGINHLPLLEVEEGLFHVLLCRLDGMSITRSFIHYNLDLCFTDHYGFISSKQPFTEVNGNSRVKENLRLKKQVTREQLENIMVSINPDFAGFILDSVSIENGLVYGLVRTADSLGGRALLLAIRDPAPDQAAILFGVRYLCASTIAEGVEYSDIKKICAYDTAILSREELINRRNGNIG